MVSKYMILVANHNTILKNQNVYHGVRCVTRSAVLLEAHVVYIYNVLFGSNEIFLPRSSLTDQNPYQAVKPPVEPRVGWHRSIYGDWACSSKKLEPSSKRFKDQLANKQPCLWLYF